MFDSLNLVPKLGNTSRFQTTKSGNELKEVWELPLAFLYNSISQGDYVWIPYLPQLVFLIHFLFLSFHNFGCKLKVKVATNVYCNLHKKE